MRPLIICVLHSLVWLAAAPGFALGLVDDEGRAITLRAPAQRIVSLAPGATEMLFAAGAGPRIVATVQFADEPAAARAIPRIGDAQAFDMERILALRPDVVVVWSSGNSAASIERLQRLGLTLYRHKAERLSELAGSLRRMGAIAATQSVADAAATQLDARIQALRKNAQSATPLQVFLQVWDHPLYTVGGQQPLSEALALCGAHNVFADLSVPGPVVSTEAVLARAPDVVVAAAQAGQAVQWLEQWRAYATLRATRSNNLIAFEDTSLTRVGPGAIIATEKLCRLLDAARARLRGVSP
ncbi:MAG: cobalamin-binding protein [Steroidobacteraceae bacterium]